MAVTTGRGERFLDVIGPGEAQTRRVRAAVGYLSKQGVKFMSWRSEGLNGAVVISVTGDLAEYTTVRAGYLEAIAESAV